MPPRRLPDRQMGARGAAAPAMHGSTAGAAASLHQLSRALPASLPSGSGARPRQPPGQPSGTTRACCWAAPPGGKRRGGWADGQLVVAAATLGMACPLPLYLHPPTPPPPHHHTGAATLAQHHPPAIPGRPHGAARKRPCPCPAPAPHGAPCPHSTPPRIAHACVPLPAATLREASLPPRCPLPPRCRPAAPPLPPHALAGQRGIMPPPPPRTHTHASPMPASLPAATPTPLLPRQARAASTTASRRSCTCPGASTSW